MFLDLFIILLFAIVGGIGINILLLRALRGRHAYSVTIAGFNGILAGILLLHSFLLEDASVVDLSFAFLFMNSYIAVHCLVLVGVLNDSPTLAIVKTLMKKEPDGLSENELNDFIRSHPFVSSRLMALNTTGDLKKEGARYYLTPRSKVILFIIEIYQNIIVRDRETG